jgi:hypothetical protein
MCLCPGLKATRNLHQLAHITDDIRAHGPVYSHWCFVVERTGKTMKNANTNGKVIETTAINARLRASTASLIQQQLPNHANTPEDLQALAKLAPFQSGFLKNNHALGSFASELYSEMQANLARLGDNNESPNGMQPDFMRLLTGTPFVPSHAHTSLILHSLNNNTQKQRGE